MKQCILSWVLQLIVFLEDFHNAHEEHHLNYLENLLNELLPEPAPVASEKQGTREFFELIIIII